MKKIITLILSFAFIGCMFINVHASEDIEVNGTDTNLEQYQVIELCEIDLSSTETQSFSIELPNGKTGYVTVEDSPVVSTRADHLPLKGKFNKRLTFTESSPLMTISAIYSGNVTSTSVTLNKPHSGQMSGAINYESGTYSTRNYSGDSKTKEALFTAKYSFPIIGTTHYMELILRVSPSSGNSNNAVLYTNGIF